MIVILTMLVLSFLVMFQVIFVTAVLLLVGKNGYDMSRV